MLVEDLETAEQADGSCPHVRSLTKHTDEDQADVSVLLHINRADETAYADVKTRTFAASFG